MMLVSGIRPFTLTVSWIIFGDYVEDEHAQLKKSLRGLLPVLAGILIAQCIYNWHLFGYRGFKTFRWDNFLVQTFGAIVATLCLGLLKERKEITTLGIAEATVKKLR